MESHGTMGSGHASIPGSSVVTCQRKIKPLISCIIPAFNETENLSLLIPQLCQQLAELSPHYEIMIIDDGSQDNTSQVAIMMASQYPIRLLQLSRNFGKENALTAGIDHVQGDAVFLLDADFQHPLNLLPVFFNHWQQGYDMVYGVRLGRKDEALWKRKLTKVFYSILKTGSDAQIDPDAGDFRLLDRKVITALRTLPERNRFMKGLYSWVGFKMLAVPFQTDSRKTGKTSFGFIKLAGLAITGITSFTSFPLRVWTVIGFTISLLSILYGGFITIRTIFFGVDLPGWATLTVGVTFLGGVQLLSIGVLGEYIARIFTEVKSRPSYVVSQRHDFDQPGQ